MQLAPDWMELLAALTAAGMTQVEIAQRCDVAQSSVSDLATGKTKKPTYDFGKALERLHEEAVKPAASAATADRRTELIVGGPSAFAAGDQPVERRVPGNERNFVAIPSRRSTDHPKA